jgi:tetratricopeptide (TPR) repeat protein
VTPIAFSRNPGRLQVTGVRASTLATIRAAVTDSAVDQLVAADLSLGAWRSHQVAAEFSAQLGVSLPRPTLGRTSIRAGVTNAPSLSDIIGDFIDAEARGDGEVLSAIENATCLASATERNPRYFAIIAPRFGASWERGDVLLVRYLVQALEENKGKLVVIWDSELDPVVPDDWEVHWLSVADSAVRGTSASSLCFVPGILDERIQATVAKFEGEHDVSMLRLSGGHGLVGPECRCDLRQVPRQVFDKLALLFQSFGWLRSYAQFFGNNFYLDPWFIWLQAREHAETGGTGIALRLLKRAVPCARDPLQRAVLQALAQGIRISSEQFHEAAAEQDPSPAAPDNLRGFLLQAKGWAHVMLGDASRAQLYFQAANDVLYPHGEKTRDYCYFLNIWALSYFKQGNLDDALRMEQKIDALHRQLDSRDSRLEYVNSINMARLYRRKGEMGPAEHCYLRAFATSSGTRSVSDCVYFNVCLARLNEERQMWSDAFACWFRAALHYVSGLLPEVLRSRVASAILNRRVLHGNIDHCAVAVKLEENLLYSARAADPELADRVIKDAGSRVEAPTFCRTDQIVDADLSRINRAVMGPGWSLLAGNFHSRPAIVSQSYLSLCRTLRALAESACPSHAWDTCNALIVDDRFGNEMPTKLAEVVDLCLRMKVHQLLLGQSAYVVNQADQLFLERSFIVSRGGAVESIVSTEEFASVKFKRQLPPARLTSEQKSILESLDGSYSVADLRRMVRVADEQTSFLTILRAMQRLRLLDITLSEDAAERLIAEPLEP